MSYHGGSSEEMEGSERNSRSRRIDPGSRTYSTSAIHLTSAPSLRSQQPNRPKGYNSDDNLFEPLQDNKPSPGGLRGPRPNSLESSRSVSNGSSPLTLKGSSSFPPVRTESISNEDLVPTRDSFTGRTGSTVLVSGGKPEPASNRNSLISYNNPEKRPPSRAQTRVRSGSPGSEMVTLEEFLDESNQLSPPTEASSSRDDMLGDYFKKAGDPPDFGSPSVQPSYRDSLGMPTNYVSPSVKLSGDVTDGKTGRPGQCVKPSLRPLDPAASPAGSLRRPQAQHSIPTSKQTPEPQHPGSMCSRGNSVSRSFSLVTADLLKANGPDLNRMEKPEIETPGGKDLSSHMLRTSTPAGSPRDRPQSARMSNPPRADDLRCQSLDTRRLSLAVPKDDRTLQTALSSSSLQQPYISAGRGKPRPISRFGEVAMVSPVRPISSIPEVEGQAATVTSKLPNAPSDCHHTPTTEEDPSKGTSPKSTPASPDPNADPHSVWYEYGCV